ncbi:MAG: hypothetical protein ACRD2I_12015, partial [Vicinamibacterales bacterium]
ANTLVLLAGLLLLCVRAQAADRQIRPLVGATFGGGTTFVDPEDAIGTFNPAIGGSAVFLGEVFGAEAEVADAPGFFESGDKHLVLRSHVTTISGNVIIAAPHRWTEYWLRPYFVAGGGLMRVSTTTSFNVFDVAKVIPQVDVGVGVVAFLTNRVGVSWDVRRFQSVGSDTKEVGLSIGGESLSFWRATMAAVIRY